MLYRIFFLFVIAFLSLEAADSNYSGYSYQRYEEYSEYFDENQNKGERTFWNRKFMTGDWGGVRQSMSDSGVVITSSIVSDLLGNPVGGLRRGFRNATSWGADITLDLEKIAKMPGMILYSSIAFRFGNNLSADTIGNQFNVAQVYGGQTFHFCDLYIQQTLFQNKFTYRLGRLSTGDTFLKSPLYAFYVNNGIDGNPVAIFFNTKSTKNPKNGIATAYPFTTWGAFAKIVPIDCIDIRFGVYNANSKISENKYHGLNFTFDNTNGVLYLTEWCFKLNQGDQSIGMPGNYKVGYYYVTGSYGKFLGGQHKGNYGYYFLFDQMVYREGGSGSDIGLTPFIALMFAPKSYAEFPVFGVIGASYQGLIPGRDKDQTSIDIIYGKYSPDLRMAQEMKINTALVGTQPQNYEIILEATHLFQLNPWFSIMPDIQYVINPKGYGTIPNALVLGAQVSLIF